MLTPTPDPDNDPSHPKHLDEREKKFRSTDNHSRREGGRNKNRQSGNSGLCPTVHSVPVQFQLYPSDSARHRPSGYVNRSPTESLSTFEKWATKEAAILEMAHQIAPPDFYAVIKFDRPVSVKDQKQFHRILRQNICNWSKRNRIQFAVYFVREIEVNNVVHLNLLVRTTYDKPIEVIQHAIRSQSFSTVRYCEPIRSTQAVSLYVLKKIRAVKTGGKVVILFTRRLGIRKCGWFCGYFQKRRTELREAWKREKFGPKAMLSSPKR